MSAPVAGNDDASAAAATALRQGSLVNEEAMNVLKMSKGVVRVPLQDLGPALFNRLGEDTSGQHCLKLGKRILALEGFATFRYLCGRLLSRTRPRRPVGGLPSRQQNAGMSPMAV